jgi:hypothetical protein
MSNSKMLYEDVLNDVMLAEDTPSYAALGRWTERYPEYAEDLREFFATWAMQAVQPGEPEIDEDRIIEQTVNRGLEILRRQGRLIEETRVEPLEPVDQLVLTAIYLLHGDADIVSITKRVNEMSEKQVLPGATALSLSRLEDRALIHSWKDEGQAGQRFTVTLSGERALAYVKETSKVLGDLLGDFA